MLLYTDLSSNLRTRYVSSTFSDSSRKFSISSLNSSISRCAMSHFCSAVRRSALSMLLLRDFERLRPTLVLVVTSCCDCDGVGAVVLGSTPSWSLGSTRRKYFSNICVSAAMTSLVLLQNSKMYAV